MKCIHCGSKTPYKVRAANGGRCAACGHAFAFEPMTDPYKLSDGLFEAAVNAVSGKGALHFTAGQLYYELCRRLLLKARRGCTPAGAGTLLLALTGLGAALAATPPLGKNKKAAVAPITFEHFQSHYLGRYETVHGRLEKRVTAAGARVASGSQVSPGELSAYSFDRALFVDNGDIAAMLVANRFHFENNCAILALDRRYPAAATYEAVMGMLRNNPGLTVFTAHDASPDGVALPRTLRSPDWFPGYSTRIVDLGLRPRQAVEANLVLTKAPASELGQAGEMLPPDEAEWLREGNRAELSAVRPASLMKRLYAGFTQVARADSDGYYDDSGIWFLGYSYGPGGWLYDPYPGYGWGSGDIVASGLEGGYDSFG